MSLGSTPSLAKPISLYQSEQHTSPAASHSTSKRDASRPTSVAFEMAAVDVKCITAGNWADFDFVGGCYRIRDQLHGVTILGLPAIEHYTVTTVQRHTRL